MLDAPVFWGSVGIGSVNEGEEDSLLCRTGALRLFSMHRQHQLYLTTHCMTTHNFGNRCILRSAHGCC